MRSTRPTVMKAVTALAVLMATGAWNVDQPALPGEAKMVNLKHVYNYDIGGTNADQGTDLEFFTSTVPLRDYATGLKILDEAGNEILAERDFAVMGSYNDAGGASSRGAFVFDITNPEAVQFVRKIPCNQGQNDVQLKNFDGRWVLALAKDDTTSYGASVCLKKPGGASAGLGGVALFDVTDPYDYKPMYGINVPDGAHNFTFHPTKPYGWVSTGELPGGQSIIPIIDFTNLSNATIVQNVAVEGGPHDVSFSPNGNRAYIASENNSRIYNSTDPANPTLISRIAGPAVYHHGFDPTPDGKIAILTDESLVLGGFFASGSAVCPGGGLTFYSIDGTLEQSPVPLGFFEADVQGKSPDHRACTGHVGKIAANSHVLVTGWYIGGVRVIDFSNPRLPTEVASAVMDDSAGKSETWAAKFYKGPYIFTADLGRGFDVFKWDGPGLAPWDPGHEH